MTKQTKVFSRTLALVLTVLMLVVAGIFAVTAADDVQSSGTWGGIDWTLTTDGTLTISPTVNEIKDYKHGNKTQLYEVGQVPCGANLAWTQYYNPWNKGDVKKLVIEEGVTSIGTFAFMSLENLTGELVIPSTVTYIGQEAIKGTKLTKITFAEGGTGSLTICQGGLNGNPDLKEIILPADRPEIHLKAWVFNSDKSLEHLFLPANVKSIGGTNYLDYKNFSTSHSAGNHSQLTFYCDKLEAITFGSKEIMDLFFDAWGNPITTVGVKNNYTTPSKVAFIEREDGTYVYGISLEAVAKLAKAGDTVTLLKNTDEVVELPAGVELETNGYIANNVTIAKPSVAQIGEQGYATLAEALAAAKDGDTIILLADNAEEFAFAQNGGKITIDGNGKTFTGKITLNAGSGELVITNATLTPSNSAAQTIVLNAATAPNITIDGCVMKNTGTKGAIVWGLASSTSNKVIIKNSTASYLQYLVGTNQTGCNNITIENVTATNMAYLIRPMKAANVIVKDVTYSGIVFAEVTVGITADATSKIFALENVSVNTTHSSYSAILMNAPDSGVSVPYTFTIKGDVVFTKNDVATKNWVMVADSAKCPYVIKNLNGLSGSGTEADPYQIGSVEDLTLFRNSVNAGETKYNAPGVYVVLTADIDMAGATWERGIGDGINATFDGVFDGKDFTIKNLKLAPKADSEKYFCGGLFGYTYGAAVIKNLVLENITVTAEGEGHNVGVLVGFANNNGGKLTISNVTVKNVTINAPETYGVGAIVGYSYRNMGTIENCTVDGATITGYRFVGGIVGYSYNDAIIIGCNVENATITGKIGVGGIAGIVLPGNNISGNTVTDTTVSAPNNWGYVVGEIAANSFTLGENNNAADPKVGGVWETGAAVEAKIGNTYYATFADAYAAAWANTYANKGAKQTIYTAAGVKYVELGVWGGIDWTLTADGTLTIAPTNGEITDKKHGNQSQLYERGQVPCGANLAWTEYYTPWVKANVKKLVIEEGVTSIGTFAFMSMKNLTGEVIIPSTVTYIGQEAFADAYMTQLTFATGGTEELCIAQGAFKRIKVTEVSLPEDRPVHLHAWVFNGCTELTTVTLPATIQSMHGTNHRDYAGDPNQHSNPTWTQSSEIFYDSANIQTITFGSEEVRNMFYAKGNADQKRTTIVAYVGLTAYSDLQAAINAAQNGETVTLIKNVTLTETLTVPAGKEITLNLNGKTISQSKACTASYEMILNKGSLTITGNGKISFNDTGAGDSSFGWGSYTIRNEGTLVVENGTIEHKGAQEFATHMICAIFQYSGSTTINGGTISTPNYRSVRLWKGEMTINGGTFDGQVWVQAVDDSAELTINGGTFEPNGNDASSVFVSNATYDVAFAVIGGTFNGKIGANNADKLEGAITNGKFNAAAKTGTSEVLYSGYAFGEADADGYYNLVANVVKNETTGKTYGTLAEALAAAQAGDTLTFLADITGDVTINKSITIDGANFKYIGTMTLSKGYDVAIKNCNFDGENGKYPYAIYSKGANSLTVTDCNVTNYLYSFLYVSSGMNAVSINKVTVENCPNYAVYFGSGVNNATITNLTVKNSNNGIILNNTAVRSLTINGCKMENVSTAINYSKGTDTITVKVLGNENDFGTATIGQYVKCVLTETTATLTAPEGLFDVIDTNVEGYSVKYENGKYVVKANKVAIGEETYASLAEAIAAAQAGDIIKFLADITEDVTISKAVTIDGANHKYTGTMTLNAGLTVTIQNVNFVNGGIAKTTKSSTGTYTIEDCTFDGEGKYAYPLLFKGANKVVVDGCTVKDYMYSFLYITSSANTVSVKDVVVENCPNYAVYFASGVTNATFEDLTVKNSNNGFIINNTANRAFTIKNCKMENVVTAIKYSGGTNAITCTISGENNDFGTATISEYAQCVLTEGATLKAIENLNVTTNLIGYTTVYDNGVYKLDLLKVNVEMTNIRMGETISHLFAIPFHKNIKTGHVAYINGAEFAFDTWKLTEDKAYYVIEYTGIAAKEMTKAVSIYITFGTDKVSAEEDLTTSVQAYAMELLGKDTSSDALKTMLVDMLNYGAAAQVYFDGKNATVLANAELTDVQKALATKSYSPCDEHQQAYDKHFMGTSVRFENAITLVFKVYLPYTTNVEDITATFGIKGEVVEITKDKDETNPYVYYIELKSLVVADAHEDVTCTVTVGNVTFAITDSVAGYAARRLGVVEAGSNAANLYTEFMKFADSAINYKENKQ